LDECRRAHTGGILAVTERRPAMAEEKIRLTALASAAG
jgi:hypothetical protein